MRLRSLLFAAVPAVCACSLSGQQPQADHPIVPVLNRIAQRAVRVRPMLDQVHAQEWIAKGAPDTWAVQLAGVTQQIGAIESDMTNLSQHPEQMRECMQALFRVQAYHRTLDSVMAGLRKYQNPALAELIQSVAGEDQDDLARLQEYILDLANQKEQEFLVVDHEAQRCRALISREPAPAQKSPRRPNP